MFFKMYQGCFLRCIENVFLDVSRPFFKMYQECFLDVWRMFFKMYQKCFSRFSLSPTCRSPSLQTSSHWWQRLLHLCLSSFLWCSASPKSLRKDWFVAISWNKLNLQQLLYLFPVTLQSVTLHYITIIWNKLNLQ